MTSHKIPNKLKPTHIPARDFLGTWYLVPFDLINSNDRKTEFPCYPYNDVGIPDISNPIWKSKRSFDL